MSKENLFKAKRKDNDEWIQGSLLVLDDGSYRIATSCLVGNAENILTVCAYDVAPDTVCQYTGLTDKNGNKIWENDVVSCGGNLVVMWNERFASFCLGKNGWMYNHFFGEAIEGCDCEVIGNIFDDPELLGE